jgi:hypothetical protein
VAKEQSEKAKEISRKIDLVIDAGKHCSDGCARAVDSFNQLLGELLNQKLHNVQLVAFQNVEPGKEFIVQLEIMYGTPQGMMRNVIGKIERSYPIPTGDELCAFISEELNRQLGDIYSPLYAVLASIRQMEQDILRQNLTRK